MFKPGDLVIVHNHDDVFNGLAEIIFASKYNEPLNGYSQVQLLNGSLYTSLTVWIPTVNLTPLNQ